jgi:proline iminopeptidase
MSGNRGAVEIAGVTLRYVVEGAGLPLLVVGSSIYYPRTFSKRLRESCTLICADVPHFVPAGAEFNPACINFDFYAQCVEAVRTDAGIGRVVIVGHSHHGNIALEYARRHPGNVSHVVVIGSPPADIATTVQCAEQYWDTHATAERKAALQRRRRTSVKEEDASRSPSESYVRQYVTDAPLYWNDPDYDASWLWDGMSFSMDAVSAFRDLYRSYELNWDDALCRIPVLVVMGANDFAVPHTLWSSLLPDLANVTFRLLEHAGHTPQLEQPEEFDHCLLNWLSIEGPTNSRST